MRGGGCAIVTERVEICPQYGLVKTRRSGVLPQEQSDGGPAQGQELRRGSLSGGAIGSVFMTERVIVGNSKPNYTAPTAK